MRIWVVRIVAVLMWLLATHGALNVVARVESQSWLLGAIAFIAVTAGMMWIAVHLGDAPFWHRKKKGNEAPGSHRQEALHD